MRDLDIAGFEEKKGSLYAEMSTEIDEQSYGWSIEVRVKGDILSVDVAFDEKFVL